MNQPSLPISPYSVTLRRNDLRSMIRLVHQLNQLSQNPAYQALLNEKFPLTFPANQPHSAVMMGYDFHLSPTGAKLIEVNTNAGGLWFAELCCQADATGFSPRLGQKLLQTFRHEYAQFFNAPQTQPKFIAIVDDNPSAQFLYPEMQIFARLFQQAGIETCIAAPEELSLQNDGLYFNTQRIDMIYNRHCDFYLQTEAMQHIRTAWLNQHVCLSPNPLAYRSLADKQRMALWSDPNQMSELNLSANTLNVFETMIPKTQCLSSLNMEEAWQTRKQWVFKPNTGYGSRGVYVGDKLTKNKLAELKSLETLIQQHVPPSITYINDEQSFKTDFRLFVYQQKVLALSARLYQGQVTNLRTENGGFAKVYLVE